MILAAVHYCSSSFMRRSPEYLDRESHERRTDSAADAASTADARKSECCSRMEINALFLASSSSRFTRCAPHRLLLPFSFHHLPLSLPTLALATASAAEAHSSTKIAQTSPIIPAAATSGESGESRDRGPPPRTQGTSHARREREVYLKTRLLDASNESRSSSHQASRWPMGLT